MQIYRVVNTIKHRKYLGRLLDHVYSLSMIGFKPLDLSLEENFDLVRREDVEGDKRDNSSKG